MKKSVLLSVLIILTNVLFGQVTELSNQGDSLYLAKNYIAAANNYLKAASYVKVYENPKGLYYNAACCYALAGDQKKSLHYLKIAILDHGYSNLDHLVKDKDLASLHGDDQWKRLIEKIESDREALSEPRKAELVTSDIHNFWKAYDAAKKDTANRKRIFEDQYFSKGSKGLQDYFTTKIGSVDAFIKNQDSKPKFYAAIRKNTLAIDPMKEEIYGYFEKLKQLYEDAVFPSIYFLIGRWNSAGTVSENGLLLGVDQIVRTPDIPQDELNLWAKNNFNDLNRIPVIVIHELIHFEQKIKEDTTLLFYALTEGMADFLCELVTGVNPSQRQQDFAKTRRKAIWEDFKKEMFLQRAYNWIANGNQESIDKPADLGYYVGYEICKAYYEQAADKKQAIRDMLLMQDHRQFLEKSGYDVKMASAP